MGDEEDEDEISVFKKKLVDFVVGLGGFGSCFKGKYFLDSDEEDDDDGGFSKYDILVLEDVEG